MTHIITEEEAAEALMDAKIAEALEPLTRKVRALIAWTVASFAISVLAILCVLLVSR